jgi:hypothetical protein
MDTSTLPVFAHRINGTNAAFNAFRASLVMFHETFTQTESSNFWILAKACRECLGGGTGDPVHDWANRITVYGGSAISSTTSNANRTFLSSLDDNALLYKMCVVNTIPPDNIIAVQMPLIAQAGRELWLNTAFGASNLTVNGIAGDGATKFMNTGISPVAMNSALTRGFSSTSVGLSILVSQITSITNTHVWGGGGTAANGFWGLQPCDTSTNYIFYAWKFVNSGTDFVAARGPVTNFTTFASGNRTAANAIALYWVTNGVHALAVNGTGNQTGSSATFTNILLSASWNLTAAAAFSPYRVSFASVHSGLTQTESSNLWVAVTALRTALGGGNP